MGRFNLNFGGWFGAVVCGGAAAAILYLLAHGKFPTRGLKLVILAAVGGATVGNWIWKLALPTEADGFSDQGPAGK